MWPNRGEEIIEGSCWGSLLVSYLEASVSLTLDVLKGKYRV